VTTVAGSTTATTSIGVTSTTAAANSDLGTDRELPDVDITGGWIVTEFTVDGEWQTVEVARNAENEPVAGADANAHHEPWIEIGEEMRGYPGGCNEFYVEYFIDGNALAYPIGGLDSAQRASTDELMQPVHPRISGMEDVRR
jgi:heat shock protein HslJ